MRVRGPLILQATRPATVTGARMRLAALTLAAGLLASDPFLPGRGTGDAVALPSPAAPLFSSSGGGILLSRVYPNAARDDEFVEMANLGAATADLSGWTLTDREAIATFPDGTLLPPGGRLVAARNATSYAEDVLAPAQFAWESGDAPRLVGGVLRLADAGDEVLLLDAKGSVVDAFLYGSSEYSGPGWSGPPADGPGRGEIAVRRGGLDLIDQDVAEDWVGPRPFRLGQSAFALDPIMVDGPAIPLVSPDNAAERLLPFLASARTSLQAAVYTLTSEGIAGVLADRARHGVRVRVLLESSPVGGVEDSEARNVAGLVSAGAEVRWLVTGEDRVKRYRYLHAKYAIVDGEGVFIGSENFGDSGFPLDGGAGNRGWSLILQDPDLAGQLRDVFDEDFDPRRRDTAAAVGDPAAALPPPPSLPPWTWPEPVGPRLARLLVGPDTSLDPDGILGLVEAARERLWIEAFYVEASWGNRANPFLEAAFAAARRGVDVRLLLDRGYWDPETNADGNEAVADAIRARARAEGVALAVRLQDATGRVERLHNKGLVVDGRAVLVSSLNWARGSATENREIGLLLEDAAITQVFEDVFREDWEGGDGLLDLAFLGDPAVLAGVYGFIAVASALSLRKLRRGGKGLKERGGMETRGPRRAPFRRGRGEVRLLPLELVAQPRPRARGGRRNRRGGEKARGCLRGSQGHRNP